jgi:DNA-binding CsgD family transcriptional regulator
MTRILIIFHADFAACSWTEDPRTPRELVMAINTGTLRVGGETFQPMAAQSACSLPELGVVVVTGEPPLVNLTPRLYQALWHIADGKTAPELARELNIQPGTVYQHYARLKERFGVETVSELLTLAHLYGLV